jgi:hypothetical protein
VTHVNGLDLVRQGAYPREADGKLSVVRVGQPDARRLDQQVKFRGIDGLQALGGGLLRAGQRGDFLGREDRLLKTAIGEAVPGVCWGSSWALFHGPQLS